MSLEFAIIFKPDRLSDVTKFLDRFYNDMLSVISEWSIYPTHIIRGDLHILKNRVLFETTQAVTDKFYKTNVKRLLQHLQIPYEFEPPATTIPKGKPTTKLNKSLIEKMKTDIGLAKSILLE